jgi:hypothetical protein
VRTRLALRSTSASGGRSASPRVDCFAARARSGLRNAYVRRETIEAVCAARSTLGTRRAPRGTDLFRVELFLWILRARLLSSARTRLTYRETHRGVRGDVFERLEQRHADTRDEAQRDLCPQKQAFPRIQGVQREREKRPDVTIQVRHEEREEDGRRARLEM